MILVMFTLTTTACFRTMLITQCAKKVVSDSPGLVDFAIGLVNSVFNLPDGQVIFFEEFEKQKNCEINSAVQKAFGLVEMTSGLVNVSFSLPEWQAVKMIFFATCYSHSPMWSIAKKVTCFDQKRKKNTPINTNGIVLLSCEYLGNLFLVNKQVRCLGCGILTSVHTLVVLRENWSYNTWLWTIFFGNCQTRKIRPLFIKITEIKELSQFC